MKVEFRITQAHFTVAQFGSVTVLLLLSACGYLFGHLTGHDKVFGFLRLLDIGAEQSTRVLPM